MVAGFDRVEGRQDRFDARLDRLDARLDERFWQFIAATIAAVFASALASAGIALTASGLV